MKGNSHSLCQFLWYSLTNRFYVSVPLVRTKEWHTRRSQLDECIILVVIVDWGRSVEKSTKLFKARHSCKAAI